MVAGSVGAARSAKAQDNETQVCFQDNAACLVLRGILVFTDKMFFEWQKYF